MIRFMDQIEKNPDLTPEMMISVDGIISKYKDKPGNLIPVLEDCQETVGYLPVELQEYISDRLVIPSSTVYGVVTFYSFFSMIPKGRHVVKLCLGTACYVKGTKQILDRILREFDVSIGGTTADRRFSIQGVRCIGACGLAPAVMINEDTHGGMSPDKVLTIMENYK